MKPSNSTTPSNSMRPSNSTRALSTLLLALVACGDDPAGTGPGAVDEGKAAVGATVNALPSWESISPLVTASADPLEGDPEGTPAALPDSDPRYSGEHLCTTTPYSLAKNPEKIITMSSNQGLLVPGVLLQGKSHLLGSLQQLRIDQRAPIDLVIDEAGALVPGIAIEAPSLSTLRAGVNTLIQDAETSGFEQSSSVFFEKVTSHSTEHAALALGLSARYLNAEASADMRTETSASQTTVAARFIQEAFTIRADGPSFVDDWFTDDFTQAVLDQYVTTGQIGPDSPPLYVLSVKYGRIVMVNFTAAESREEVEAVFEAGYRNGVGSLEGKLTAEQESMMQSADIRVVSLGGPAEGGFQFAKEILNPGDPDAIGLDGFFAQDVALTTFVPISYTIADLRTGAVAVVGETTQYDVLECARRAESDFEQGDEGWVALYGRPGEDPRWREDPNYARSGTGYISVMEDNNLATYMTAPGKYLEDKELYYGGTLTYWAHVDCGLVPSPTGGTTDPDCATNNHAWFSSTGNADLIIESDDSPKILLGRIGQDELSKYTWVQRSIPLEAGPGMYVYNPSLGQTQSEATLATEAEVREILADISRLRIRAEFMAGAVDWIFIDDVRMIPPEL